MTIDGETRITGLIGDPVAHSRSPAILNAAYREGGLNWIYAAFPVPRGHGGDAVRGARELRFAGLTVTEQSLRAALAPADVPYLFYVTGKDGVTYYATTLAEHEANIKAHGVRGE